MELHIDNATLDIKGNIINASDFEAIKAKLETIKEKKTLTLNFHDSLVINSSLIGYLVKLINQEGVHITLNAGSPVLVELLEDIGLASTFNVNRIM